MNIASFETKTCQDNRIINKHWKIMYPTIAKNTSSEVGNRLRLQTFEKLIGPPHPHNTLFARQMKHYEPTTPI